MSTVYAERSARPGRLLVTGSLVAAAAMLLVALVSAAGSERLGHDFRATYLPAAHAVRLGESPLTNPASPLVGEGEAYAYPPLLAVLLVPFTAVGTDLAAFVAFAASLAALIGALWVLGVRDLRCYAALLLWAPAFDALEMANVSAGLAFVTALAWRYRDALWPLAACLALAVATKLFLWPLVVWAAAARRIGAAAWSVALSAVLVLGSWAVVAFAGLTTFPRLLEVSGERESYSVVGIVHSLGFGWTAGRVVAAVMSGALLAWCVALGRDGDDVRAFTCAVTASLALTPILWQHYLILLVVPLALVRPRFSALWLLPIVLWMAPRSGTGVDIQPFLPALVAALLMAALVWRPRVRAAEPTTAS